MRIAVTGNCYRALKVCEYNINLRTHY